VADAALARSESVSRLFPPAWGGERRKGKRTLCLSCHVMPSPAWMSVKGLTGIPVHFVILGKRKKGKERGWGIASLILPPSSGGGKVKRAKAVSPLLFSSKRKGRGREKGGEREPAWPCEEGLSPSSFGKKGGGRGEEVKGPMA